MSKDAVVKCETINSYTIQVQAPKAESPFKNKHTIDKNVLTVSYLLLSVRQS